MSPAQQETLGLTLSRPAQPNPLAPPPPSRFHHPTLQPCRPRPQLSSLPPRARATLGPHFRPASAALSPAPGEPTSPASGRPPVALWERLPPSAPAPVERPPPRPEAQRPLSPAPPTPDARDHRLPPARGAAPPPASAQPRARGAPAALSNAPASSCCPACSCFLGKFGSLDWNREPNRTNRNRIGSVPAFKKNRSVPIL